MQLLLNWSFIFHVYCKKHHRRQRHQNKWGPNTSSPRSASVSFRQYSTSLLESIKKNTGPWRGEESGAFGQTIKSFCPSVRDIQKLLDSFLSCKGNKKKPTPKSNFTLVGWRRAVAISWSDPFTRFLLAYRHLWSQGFTVYIAAMKRTLGLCRNIRWWKAHTAATRRGLLRSSATNIRAAMTVALDGAASQVPEVISAGKRMCK